MRARKLDYSRFRLITASPRMVSLAALGVSHRPIPTLDATGRARALNAKGNPETQKFHNLDFRITSIESLYTIYILNKTAVQLDVVALWRCGA